MHSSQNNLMNNSRNVLIAMLSVIFIWQYLHLQSAIWAEHHQPAIVAVALPQNVQPSHVSKPVISKIQQEKNAYKNAKFLAVVTTPEKVEYSKSDLFCLAKNVFHEAGNQPDKGKIAVAQVTVNRTKDPKFAGRVCDVVLARNQFSWANNHRVRWTHPSGEQWDTSVKIAQEVLVEGKRIKGMEHALFYHANYVSPHWHHVARLTQIGAHIFYVRSA